ncbi:MAG: hypothetical protein MR210_03965 [Erysipelotrichaceae bacterium]|nr:hypothetical protein [Erysipelotrichaceae bacterium]
MDRSVEIEINSASLLKLIEEKFKKYRYLENSFESIMVDDKECSNVIKKILNDDYFEKQNDILYSFQQARARHILLTYFIGLVFSDAYLMHKKEHWEKLWFITALYHDSGYYSKEISNDRFDIKKHKFYLLNSFYNEKKLSCLNDKDNYFKKNVLAHSYDQIEKYDRYIRQFHENNNDVEIVDHGILGGVLTFDKLVNNFFKTESKSDDLIEIKESCLAIAQHNIFKSSSENYDNLYLEYGLDHLISTSKFKINDTTPLLYFLCLVDTIECIKKFAKAKKDRYLKTKTILSNIFIDINNNSITIDYSKLLNHIMEADEKSFKRIKKKEEINFKELFPVFENYYDDVLNLDKWTTFDVYEKNSYIVKIRI